MTLGCISTPLLVSAKCLFRVDLDVKAEYASIIFKKEGLEEDMARYVYYRGLGHCGKTHKSIGSCWTCYPFFLHVVVAKRLCIRAFIIP